VKPKVECVSAQLVECVNVYLEQDEVANRRGVREIARTIRTGLPVPRLGSQLYIDILCKDSALTDSHSHVTE
jgi:hypothetical protein